MTQTIAWLWWIGGLVGITAGVVLLALALFRDRSRGRRRCPKCWYAMDGIPGLTCPECGYAATREKRLLRTRRHWRWTIAGLALMTMGVGAALLPTLVTSDPWTLVPNAILIRLVPDAGKERDFPGGAGLVPRPEHPASIELRKRINRGELTSRQWRVLLERTHIIRTRATWPEDVTVEVQVQCPAWCNGIIVMEARLPEATRLQVADRVFRDREDHAPFRRIGRLASGTTSITFDTKVMICLDGPPGSQSTKTSVAWTGVVRLPVRAVEKFETVCPPTDDPAITAALRRCTWLGFGGLWTGLGEETPVPYGSRSGGQARPYLMIDLDEEARRVTAATAIYCCVEIVRDGVVWERYGGQLGHPLRGETAADRPSRLQLPFRPDDSPRPWHSTGGPNPSGWTIRIRGIRGRSAMPLNGKELLGILDQPHLLTQWDADRYWTGSYEIPLSELLAK